SSWRAAVATISGVCRRPVYTTSKPSSRRPRARTFAPRSWPSRPGFAMRTLIGRSGMSRLCLHRPMPLSATDAARKTKLAAATSPAILNATPEDRAAFEAVLGRPIPDAVAADHDWILLYAADRTTLEAALPSVAGALATPGTLW